MAERKGFTPVLRPDPDYTKRIERKPAAQKFMIREDPNEADASQEGESAKPDEHPAEIPDNPVKAAKKEEGRAPTGRETAAAEAQRSANTTAKTAKLRLHIAIPAELAARAEKAAGKARCPTKKIALAALNEIKPSLLERLNSLGYGEVEAERQENVGLSISTTWQIPEKTETHLKAELDPLAIGQVNRLVSHWIRGEFLDHFEKYLKKLGH